MYRCELRPVNCQSSVLHFCLPLLISVFIVFRVYVARLNPKKSPPINGKLMERYSSEFYGPVALRCLLSIQLDMASWAGGSETLCSDGFGHRRSHPMGPVGRVPSNFGGHRGDQVYLVPSSFRNWLSFFSPDT